MYDPGDSESPVTHNPRCSHHAVNTRLAVTVAVLMPTQLLTTTHPRTCQQEHTDPRLRRSQGTCMIRETLRVR